jgi:small-conductance mechanosensitive channel
MRNATWPFLLALALLSFLIGDPTIAYPAQESTSGPPAKPALESGLGQSVEETLKVEQENLRQLKEQLDAVQLLKETSSRELDAYKLQMSVHGNLLMLPTSEVADLEKATDDHKATLNAIAVRLETLRGKRDAIDRLRLQTEEKYTLNEKQLAEMKTERPKDGSAKARITQFEALVQLLSNQRTTISEILDIYSKRISQLEQTQQALSTLTERFDQEIRIRKKQDLFKRNVSPLASLGWVSMKEDFSRIIEQTALLMTVDFWVGQARSVWVTGWFSFYMFLFLLLLVYILFVRMRHYCTVCMNRPDMVSRPWTVHALKLIQHSLPLMGATAFLYSYARVRLVYSSVPLIRTVVHGLLVLLLCRWALDSLQVWFKGEGLSVSQRLQFRLRVLMNGVRAFAIAYIIVFWMIGESSVLFFSRVFFELVLFVWSVSFLKAFRLTSVDSPNMKSRRLLSVVPLVVGLGYTISGGGVLLEFAGYGKLAVHWYISWGRSIIVLMWACLLSFALREWNVPLTKVPKVDESDAVDKASPVKWLFLRLSWLVWAGAVVLSVVFAWGGSQTVVVGLVGLLSHPIKIGNMNLRLVGFIYAAIILLCIHAAARLLRRVLRDRILSDSGLDLGVQESVTTVTMYLFWGLGILLSLNVMGLSATSIAVAFGALSIGLGFGLQNIFNNFVSGLILLFERPVQVGNVVQINEIWGIVTKINVRSTVVQTYDNASLIIPNSDMISNQVTNWSFKDPRLRRSIIVGVAYGSNTELVRETLLEVAREHPKVLKRPKPDVLFEDFGDSALIFKLRLWTTIDHFIAVETDVRFSIDRLFRERGIEIAFPQRDIHIRSTVEKAELNKKAKE